MPDLPQANTTVEEGAGAIGPNSGLVCVLSCMQSGTPAEFKQYDSAANINADKGLGEGYEFAAHYIPQTKRPILFARLEEATAGAISNVDLTNVSGTSEPSFNGTPFDDEELKVLVADDGNDGAGGNVGTSGIVIQVSRDGGRTLGRKIRLGTATSYAIPNTGVTVSFGAGTLKTGDYATCVATSPKWDATSLAAAITELVNRTDLPRAILVCGDCAGQTELRDVIAQAQALAGVNRFSRLFCSLRDYFPRAVFQGSKVITAALAGQTVTVAATGKTFTRSAGSFITDGFAVGDEVTWAGFSTSGNNGPNIITTLTATVMTCAAASLTDESAAADTSCSTASGGESVTVAASGKTYTRSGGSWITEGFKVGTQVVFGGFAEADNNGPKTITDVTATVVTVSETCADEATVYGVTAIATETDSQWSTALAGVVGSTPSTELVEKGVSPFAGRARRVSPTDGSMKRRPAAWFTLIRWMQHDPQIAPYRTADKGLDGVTITDANGKPEDHDERTMGGLLDSRISCLRTYSEYNLPGVYVALSLTLDAEGTPLSRLQVAGVSDIISTVVQGETALKLGSEVETNDDGTLTEAEARRIELGVLGQLKAKVLSPGAIDGRPAASSITFSISRTVNVLEEGAEVPTETDWVPLGYLEKINNKVRVQTGS